MIKIIMILASLIILFQSCDTTEPRDKIEPGRRDYEWTIDTLDAPYNTYSRMWGSSPTDIWLVSDGDWDKSIAHYNGENWTLYGVNGMIAPFAIYGFSSDNIYIGAENGKIWNYNGNNWNLVASLTKEGTDFIIYENIWGESAQDIYAVGNGPDQNLLANYSVIAHFTKNEWKVLNADKIKGNVHHLFQDANDRITYLQVLKIGGGMHEDSTLIYKYTNEVFTKLYSSVWTQGQQADISLIDGEVYFILGNKIAKRENDKFTTVLNVDNSHFYQRIWGRTSKDIFLLMLNGLVHYNGNDMEYLFYFNTTPRTQIYGACLFEKDVFFLVYEANTNLNLIYHGILK